MPTAGPAELAALIAQAQKALVGGDLAQAAALVAAGLAAAPDDAELLTLRGALAQQSGERERALGDFERVVVLEPRNAPARLNLGTVLAGCGRWADARRELELAVTLDGQAAAAWSALGRVCWQMADTPAARAAFAEAARLESRVASRHHDRGVLESAAGEHVAALEAFTRACVLDRGAWRSQLGRAQEWAALGNPEAARRCWQAVAERHGDHPEVWSAWAAGLAAQETPAEMLAVCEAGLARHPGLARLLLLNAAALRDLDRPDVAERCWSEAKSAAGEQLAAVDWSLGGKIAWDRGEFALAASRLERSVAAEPERADHHVNLAGARLIQGDFARGWPEYAWRVRVPGFSPDPARCPELPWWDGTPRGGRHLWVHAEQGLGDELLFANCLDDLLAEPGPVTWTCDPRLVGLLQRSFPGVDVRSRSATPDSAAVDDLQAGHSRPELQVLAGSLPGVYRRRFEDFPRRIGWLKPALSRVTQWRERLAGLPPGLKVGISWCGGVGGRERRLRTLPLACWKSLLARPGVVPVSLQYGDATAEIQAAVADGFCLESFAELDPWADLEGLAALIAALDLVISVPNATVHLAGAVGTPTWALVRHAPDWRWFSRGESCPWYGSVRLLRQPSPGDWSSVLSRAGELLEARLKDPRGDRSQAAGLGEVGPAMIPAPPELPVVIWEPADLDEGGGSHAGR